MASDIIQSVDRALEFLIYLYNEGKETSVTQIANDLGVYKSTVFRTLATMEARGFGNRLFTLGKSVENRMGLREIVKPYVSELYDLYREVINVSVLERNQNDIYKSVIIYKADNPNQVLKANPSVGSSSECHCSSVGKCLLAFGQDVDLSVYESHPLTVYTEYTISSLEQLKEELDDVREKGYAIDREELELGLTCIGAPILDHSGHAIAAISLSGPKSRMLAGDFCERVRAVTEVARKISANF